jgi:hypothetical protein
LFLDVKTPAGWQFPISNELFDLFSLDLTACNWWADEGGYFFTEGSLQKRCDGSAGGYGNLEG